MHGKKAATGDPGSLLCCESCAGIHEETQHGLLARIAASEHFVLCRGSIQGIRVEGTVDAPFSSMQLNQPQIPCLDLQGFLYSLLAVFRTFTMPLTTKKNQKNVFTI